MANYALRAKATRSSRTDPPHDVVVEPRRLHQRPSQYHPNPATRDQRRCVEHACGVRDVSNLGCRCYKSDRFPNEPDIAADDQLARSMSLISIIIPTCNRSRLLSRLLESVSDISDIEVIVVDDSSDRSEATQN